MPIPIPIAKAEDVFPGTQAAISRTHRLGRELMSMGEELVRDSQTRLAILPQQNRLELALLDLSDMQLGLYLEDVTDAQVRRDVEDIRCKAALSTDAGVLREAILSVLNGAVC